MVEFSIYLNRRVFVMPSSIEVFAARLKKLWLVGYRNIRFSRCGANLGHAMRKCVRTYADSKDPDQPAHPRTVNRTLPVRL